MYFLVEAPSNVAEWPTNSSSSRLEKVRWAPAAAASLLCSKLDGSLSDVNLKQLLRTSLVFLFGLVVIAHKAHSRVFFYYVFEDRGFVTYDGLFSFIDINLN